MEIVHATTGDVPGIIGLMKLSLGEELMPKSERFFRWKHEENPFGRSLMLLAKEDGKFIGFRSFMRWEWALGNEKVKAVRAVDTSTHPDYRGRGIFTKLTLRAIRECEDEGAGLIFNTPNPVSRIGYLKMGWESTGRMPLLAGPGSLFPAFYSPEGTLPGEFQPESILPMLTDDLPEPEDFDYFHTPISMNYLKWRYAGCPVADYGMMHEKNAFGLVFRLKPFGKFTELRICEIWIRKDKISRLKLNTAIKKLKQKFRPLLISCAPGAAGNELPGLWGPFRRGPEVTLRRLCIRDLATFKQYSLWKPSIGSLELF